MSSSQKFFPFKKKDLLEILQSEEEILLTKLKLIQEAKKIEERRIKEEEAKKTPLIIEVNSVNYGTVYFTAHNIEGKVNVENSAEIKAGRIHIDDWEKFEEDILALQPNTEFKATRNIKDPYWLIIKKDKEYHVKWNPRTNLDGYYRRLEVREADGTIISLNRIPGAQVSSQLAAYKIPLPESWRLFALAPDLKTRLVMWDSEESYEYAKGEFAKRQRFETIHTAKDSDFDYTFEHWPEFKLKPHQRVGLEFLDLTNANAIIAYTPGKGKTAIALADAMRRNSKKILIVCPGALRINWKRHIKKHSGEDAILLASRLPTKYDNRALFIEKPRFVIINYDILRSKNKFEKDEDAEASLRESDEHFLWVDLINLWNPDYIIVDESHYMGNHSSSQSKAVRLLESEHKVTLTGTPIKNRPGELWPVLNWLKPEMFKFYETFLNQYGYGNSVVNPENLRSLLTTIMIKRNTEDIYGDKTPPIERVDEAYEMPERYRKVYDKILMGLYQELSEFDPKGIGHSEYEGRLVKAILPKINFMRKVCAAGKAEFTADKMTELGDALGESEEKYKKVLGFTFYQGSCVEIARRLGGEENGVLSFVKRTKDGFRVADMNERMTLVDRFQSDPSVKYLVATMGTMSEGLDATEAGAVVFNDIFWNPAKHIQCEGRAFHRESDMHGGESAYLTFSDSIEEWLSEMCGIKQNTIDQIVEGKNVDFSVTNLLIQKIRQMFEKRTGRRV